MLNKVSIIGHVGFVETKVLDNGNKRTKLSVALREHNKDAEGKWVEKTTWVGVQSFQKLAEIMEKKVNKGDLVYIEGKLQLGKYTDANGVEHNVASIIANEYKGLTPKGEKEPSQAPAKHGNVKESKFIDDDIPW